MKRFYKFLLADVPGYEKVIPLYHQWFIPCVRHWLKEYQHSAMIFVDNAWDDDKNNDKVINAYLYFERYTPELTLLYSLPVIKINRIQTLFIKCSSS